MNDVGKFDAGQCSVVFGPANDLSGVAVDDWFVIAITVLLF